MKKLTCTLLVAMTTMVSMVFAQIIGGGSEGPSFIVKNKTTNETKTIAMNSFTSMGSNNYEYDVDFCFGVYNGDQIEVAYSSPTAGGSPQFAWSSSWNGGFVSDLGTASTANLKVEGITSNGKTLTITCVYKPGALSSILKTYKINFQNAHKGKRIYVTNSDIRTIQIFYEDYYKEDVFSCSGQYPTTALYKVDGTPVSSGRLNALGMGSLTAKGAGFYVVKVMVNNQVIFTETIRIN